MEIELLTKNYNALSLEQRINAIEEAKRVAREEAQADNSAAGGVEQMNVNYKVYYTRII
jgi:hypothetical protein